MASPPTPSTASRPISGGKCCFSAQSGPLSPVSLIQLDGGKDTKYVVAVNDSCIATQADCYQALVAS